MSTDPTASGDDAAYSTVDDAQPASELMATALVPKFAAVFSLFGSSMILYELYLDWRQGNARDGATSRILISMSVSDIFFSLGWFLTTWPAPSDLTYIQFNAGNQATCVFQGFLIQLGFVASPLFNVTLALFFLLRIRYRWTDFRLRQVEPWIQGSLWAFSLACAIYPIPLGLYNNAYEICWLESYPMDCLDSYRYGEDADCTRGDNAWIHALVFQIFPPWVCVFCALIFMGMIYATVRNVEQRNTRYAGSFVTPAEVSGVDPHSLSSSLKKSRISVIIRASFSRSAAQHANKPEASVVGTPAISASSQQPGEETSITPRFSATSNTLQARRRSTATANHQRSDKVATQAMWYIAAFFATYLLEFISAVCWYVKDLWWFWLDIFAYFFLPLQGFFNFCVFIRTRKMKSRLGQVARKVLCCLEGMSVCMVMQKALRFCHCCGKDNDNNTTMSGGGDGGDKKIVKNPGRALPPPSNADNLDQKTTRVSFASPGGERIDSTSPWCPPNPSDKISTDHPSPQNTTKASLPLSPTEETSTPSTNSRRLDDSESHNNGADAT